MTSAPITGTTTTERTLTLRRETLRTLNTDELRLVNGGRRSQCTLEESGCM